MTGFDAFELYMDMVTGADGRRYSTYSHTPKQVVKVFKKRGMKLWVARGSCVECVLTPERCISSAHAHEMERRYVETNVVPECVLGAVAHFRHRDDVPDCIYCYAFYYQHWGENIFLRELQDAGLIGFWDMSEMETVAGSGLVVMGYPL
jgi:hypothetical protein